MAKKKQPSSRSRAARRAVSPPPELADSADSATAAPSGKVRVMEHIAELTVRGEYGDDDDDGSQITQSLALGVANARSNKVSKTGAVRKAKLSSKQKKRQLDAVLRAESLKDVLSSKVEQSKDKFRNIIKERKKDWQDFNKNVIPDEASSTKKTKTVDDVPSSAPSSNPFALLDTEDS